MDCEVPMGDVSLWVTSPVSLWPKMSPVTKIPLGGDISPWVTCPCHLRFPPGPSSALEKIHGLVGPHG